MLVTIVMVRVYETQLTYEAENFQDAINQASQDDTKYSEELEQCNVVAEYYEQF